MLVFYLSQKFFGTNTVHDTCLAKVIDMEEKDLAHDRVESQSVTSNVACLGGMND